MPGNIGWKGAGVNGPQKNGERQIPDYGVAWEIWMAQPPVPPEVGHVWFESGE